MSSYSEEELLLDSKDWMLCRAGFGGGDVLTLKTNRGTQIINVQ
jgi:hypothetical protein